MKEARSNLEIARSYILEEIVPSNKFFLKQFGDGIVLRISGFGWLLIGVFVLMFSAMSYYLSIISEGRFLWVSYQNWTFIWFIASIFIASFSYYSYDYRNNDRFAIYMEEFGTLKTAPDEISEDVLNLSEGLKVLIMDELEGWYLIRLEDYQQGWVEAEDVVRI